MATINGVVQAVAGLGADPGIRAERAGVLGHNRRKGGPQSLIATDPAKLLVVRQITVENRNFDTIVPERFETIEQRIMLGRDKSTHDQKIEADLHNVSPLLPTSGLAPPPAVQVPGDSRNFGTRSLIDPMRIDGITASNGLAGGTTRSFQNEAACSRDLLMHHERVMWLARHPARPHGHRS